MTTSWKEYTDLERSTARHIFEALRQRDDLDFQSSDSQSDESPGDSHRLVSFSELFDAVRDPARQIDAEFSAVLSANPRLAADLRQLIANLASYQAPRLAAASTGTILSLIHI